VVNEFTISKESDISESEDLGSSLLCCQDFEVFARSTGKENCKAGELENGN
jgi:hypothetical protein